MEITREILSSYTSHLVGVTLKQEYPDPAARHLLKAIKDFFHVELRDLKIIRLYYIKKQLLPEQIEEIAEKCLSDPIFEKVYLETIPEEDFHWSVEVGYKSGVTDNVGRTAQITIEDYIGIPFEEGESVHSSIRYLFKGTLNADEVEKIAKELLGNALIEDIKIHPCSLKAYETPLYELIDLNVSDKKLEQISKKRQLALSLSEMKVIQTYFSRNDVQEVRVKYGLSFSPTDVELEVLAQTWSEHCKHKIFAAKIDYRENGKNEVIDGLFRTYIKKATQELWADCPWLVSVFTDNAGIIRLNDKYNIAFKVETHNSPSALDPYGGALTGILGVNRDIMGAGIGARPIANTNVLCFAPPDYMGDIPPRLQHPKRVFEGVRRGIEHGGNKSGIPTINGAIIFDKSYLGKPLVYCGTVGIIPSIINNVPSHEKTIEPEDVIVIAGGRTGVDGIHGATFSSEELHADSPSSAVQIGDPFTQKKLSDFLIEARDLGLYRTLTDNGAGGFSSSIGELAQLSNGCEIHLDKALLKYPGLAPWEILLSESQERMTLAASKDKVKELMALAAIHEVEVVVLGKFTSSGFFHALYKGKSVALLSLSFMHNELPQMELQAEWFPSNETPLKTLERSDYSKDLNLLLSDYNICSKEAVIRQYDHEVQGGTILKPLVGLCCDGPGDAAIIRPVELFTDPDQTLGVVVANGICPNYSLIDPYHMTACAIDEAIRNCVAVGCDPSRIAILDNFSWPDPIYHPHKNPDGKYKLAQLVRSNKALYDYSKGFMVPIISGKDSMKNDYNMEGIKISILPTLLISSIGIIPDFYKAVSMDVKQPEDFVYIIGLTKAELGGSAYASMLNLKGGNVPKVNMVNAKETYRCVYEAMQKGLIASCHDCSEGGLAVALAEISFAGGLGLEIYLKDLPLETAIHEGEILFSETPSRFVVSIDPLKAGEFEQCLKTIPFAKIGKVRADDQFLIYGKANQLIISDNIDHLKQSWLTPLKKGSL